MLLIILLYALFGSSFPISKTLLEFCSPIFLTGIRMFIAGSILLIYQYSFAKHHFHFRLKNIGYYLQIVFFGIYLTYILRFVGLASLSSAKTAFLFNVAPFFSAFYSYLSFKEKLTTQQWAGLAIGFMGLLPILISRSNEQGLREFLFISWPEFAVMLAVACHSYSWIVMRKLIREKSYAPSMINGMTMFTGGVFALITAYFVEASPQPMENPTVFLLLLILVILISNLICHNLYAHLLRSYSATFLSFAGFLGPLFSAFYGWLFLGEIITWHFYTSAVIVFIGLFLFYQHEL